MRRVDRYRKRRERAPWPGMMRHQDGSQHQWVAGQYGDLIVIMDDATNEHYSMFFCDQEGTQSRFRGVREVQAALAQVFLETGYAVTQSFDRAL